MMHTSSARQWFLTKPLLARLARPRHPQRVPCFIRTHIVKPTNSDRPEAHGHSHEHGSDSSAQAISLEEKAHRSAIMVTWLGLAKNISLCAGKFVVGIQSNSAALVADAAHSLSDMISDGVAMATLQVARKPPNPLHPYGHGKFEAIGALSVSAMLMAAGGGLVWHAAEVSPRTVAPLNLLSVHMLTLGGSFAWPVERWSFRPRRRSGFRSVVLVSTSCSTTSPCEREGILHSNSAWHYRDHVRFGWAALSLSKGHAAS